MKKHTKKPNFSHDVCESLKAAASRSGEAVATLKAAKDAGCPAFKPGNRVNLGELVAWITLHPEVKKKAKTVTKLDDKIKAERLRKFKMENDIKADLFVSREWVASRIHLAFGKIQSFRQKSEAEHPLRFAAAAGDVSACREVVQKIWDEIMASMQSLESEFREPGESPEGTDA